MENLITKNLSYIELRNSLKEDETEIQNAINSILSPSVKERLIDEAKDFYANLFGVNKEDIWYGDISNRYPECKNPFPYSHVIGTVDLSSSNIKMDKLVYCININSTGISKFPNLEIIENTGNFNGTARLTSAITYLPKLKKAPYLYCGNSNLKELGLKQAVRVNLTSSKIEKIELETVEQELSVAFSPIKDISSLTKVGKLNARNTHIEKVNPQMIVYENLISTDSNIVELLNKTAEVKINNNDVI